MKFLGGDTGLPVRFTRNRPTYQITGKRNVTAHKHPVLVNRLYKRGEYFQCALDYQRTRNHLLPCSCVSLDHNQAHTWTCKSLVERFLAAFPLVIWYVGQNRSKITGRPVGREKHFSSQEKHQPLIALQLLPVFLVATLRPMEASLLPAQIGLLDCKDDEKNTV